MTINGVVPQYQCSDILNHGNIIKETKNDYEYREHPGPYDLDEKSGRHGNKSGYSDENVSSHLRKEINDEKGHGSSKAILATVSNFNFFNKVLTPVLQYPTLTIVFFITPIL